MPLSASELASELLSIIEEQDGASPPTAEQGWATAFSEYFKDATFNGVQVLPGPVETVAMEAMRNAMAFDSSHTPIQGAQVIATGLLSFWLLGPATAITAYWPLALPPVTPPPAIVGSAPVALASALLPVFAANMVPGVTREQSADALAAVIHPLAGLTGTAVLGVTPTPIL